MTIAPLAVPLITPSPCHAFILYTPCCITLCCSFACSECAIGNSVINDAPILCRIFRLLLCTGVTAGMVSGGAEGLLLSALGPLVAKSPDTEVSLRLACAESL